MFFMVNIFPLRPLCSLCENLLLLYSRKFAVKSGFNRDVQDEQDEKEFSLIRHTELKKFRAFRVFRG